MYIRNERYREDLKSALHGIVNYQALYHKKILITGATGLIGSFLTDMLLYADQTEQADIQVYALGRNARRLRDRFRSFQDRKELHFLVQDVMEPLQLEERVDYIIHAAGDGYPAAFKEHPVETMTPAVIGTYQLLDYARRVHAERFLYVSSGEIYGKLAGGRHAFTEKEQGYIDSMAVRSCYPEAKRCAEAMSVSFWEQYKVQTVVARLSHTYGAGTGAGDNRATVQFLKEALNGRNIRLYSAGNQLRSYVYVADSVSGLMTVLLRGEAGEAYNVGNTQSAVTIAQFAQILAETAGRQCLMEQPTEDEAKEQTPIEYAVLDTGKLQQLGWKPQYDIHDGISQMVEIAQWKDKEAHSSL